MKIKPGVFYVIDSGGIGEVCLKSPCEDKQAEGTTKVGSTHLGVRDFLATIPGSQGSGEAGKEGKSLQNRRFPFDGRLPLRGWVDT